MQAVTSTQIASGDVVKVSSCRSCGARVIWTVTENGNLVTLCATCHRDEHRKGGEPNQ